MFLPSDPAGIRTQDPYIKSVLLYQLSYGIINFVFRFARFASISVIEGTKVTEGEKYAKSGFKKDILRCGAHLSV